MTEIAPDASETSPAPSRQPFTVDEIDRSLVMPFRLLEIVLAERTRLVANVTDRRHLLRLSLSLALGSVLFALPYGAVFHPERFWDVALLFVGSMGICFPSLLVFSAYLGAAVTVSQNLVLALIITTSSALFCFGFFPIQWFLDFTMTGGSEVVTSQHIAIGLLTASLIAGISQLNRCLFGDRALRAMKSNPLLLVVWQGLLLFITYRMAVVLGIVR